MNESNYINFLSYGDILYQLVGSLPLLLWCYIIYQWIWLSHSLSDAVSSQQKHLIRLNIISKSSTFSNSVINLSVLFMRAVFLLFWILFPFLMFIYNTLRAEDISTTLRDPDLNDDGLISIKEFLLWLSKPFKLINITTGKTANVDLALKTAALPPGMQACMSTAITKQQKEAGVLAQFDWKCRQRQTSVIQKGITSLVDSFYYINYCLFLIVLLTFTHQSKYAIEDWRKNPSLINWILISLLFGIIGTTLTVLESYQWWSMIFVNMSTVLLSMNIASFAILIMAIVNAIYFSKNSCTYCVF